MTVEAMSNVDKVFFDYVTAEEVEDAAKHEQQVFPAGEADTPEQFRYRFAHARHLFLGAFVPIISRSGHPRGRKLIGHVCGTQSALDDYTKESMSIHTPYSPSICVHSVCLVESFRSKGIGSRMMREYFSRVQWYRFTQDMSRRKPKRILLLCHDEKKRFYEKLGFVCKGKSGVVYGAGVWYEMHFDLDQN
ncbi:hypothetical protein AGABI1DRAFT_79781 [Agaricus bisporus var. burnettii JB137-S8]|uniref:N-acetyltransferase domain-containing protein n=2 Tax=Agaricus bisporus var. burnettii TaxID=192524 RepID=K5VM27_AGABU|nr:uncharacterized protein AGABI1DRAFT_79781 [Agaricus bisporus var. burnettii JB137-S8]EKM75479.1 hypothetical protein AGABI1DRAFT_79781 [Agaricus bisporus var. burnettii JB137-S8]KAF7768409.1 hypothetical protein Agabi119p4_7652 [Agaricus bisporus var. burnettii]